jgi:hypothetical protein
VTRDGYKTWNVTVYGPDRRVVLSCSVLAKDRKDAIKEAKKRTTSGQTFTVFR